MDLYEYKVIEVSGITYKLTGREVDTGICQNKLNELAKQGWRLISTTPIGGSNGDTKSFMFTLERKLNA